MKIGFIAPWIYAAALALVACRQEAPAVPEAAAPPPVSSVPATPADARDANVDITLPLVANAVARCEPTKTAYAKGEAVQLEIDLNQAPEGLKVSSRVFDKAGKVVASASKPGAGQKSVTLQMEGKLRPGKYKIEGYWGGNLVCEHEITVR